NPDARAAARASNFPTLVVSVVIAMVRLRGLLQIDELAGLGGVEGEVDRTAGGALALDPLAVAQQLLHDRLGEVGRPAKIAGLRRVAEPMAQDRKSTRLNSSH